MSQRLDAIAVRKWTDKDGNEKTNYTNLGSAWAFRDKEGYTLRLDAIPAPQDGQYTILLVTPKQDSNKQQRQPARQTKASFSEDLNDSVPFAPSVL